MAQSNADIGIQIPLFFFFEDKTEIKWNAKLLLTIRIKNDLGWRHFFFISIWNVRKKLLIGILCNNAAMKFKFNR